MAGDSAAYRKRSYQWRAGDVYDKKHIGGNIISKLSALSAL